jgi:hypothetical protein
MMRSVVLPDRARSKFSGAPPMPRQRTSRLTAAWPATGRGQFGKQLPLRYRYRLVPTVEQRQALACAFGCARVVSNDALRLREGTYMAARPFISDGEVLRLVTTLAKRTLGIIALQRRRGRQSRPLALAWALRRRNSW